MSRGDRVMMLMTDLLIGGVPTVVRQLAAELHRQGVDVQVAALGEWGPAADQIQAQGVRVKALGAKSALNIGVFEALVRHLRQQRTDVLFSVLLHANVAAAYARFRLPGLRLIQSIATTQPNPHWHWRLQGLIAPLAERFIVPSQAVVEVAARRSMIARSRFVVVPNPVDVAGLSQITPASWTEPIRVGFLGRLDPIKRIPDLLEAIALLGDEVQLEIFGTGEHEPLIRRQIAAMGIASRVRLHGAVADASMALPHISTLVLPSAAEGFGMVLAEAMAAGVPVVASDIPGIREVVDDGQTGLLVPVGSPRAIADAIKRLVKDEALRCRLVEQGRRIAHGRYSIERVAQGYRRMLGV